MQIGGATFQLGPGNQVVIRPQPPKTSDRPEQVQQIEQAYSITSSARAMSVGGTVMPNRTNQFIVLQHRHNKECANTGDLRRPT
jgi:hypothetical protein